MSNAKISVERYIEQVTDGRHYKGWISMGGVKFDYEVRFGLPASRIARARIPKTMKGLRNRYQITLKRGDAQVEIADEEYVLFCELIVNFVFGFYKSPKVRQFNSKTVTDAVAGKGEGGWFGLVFGAPKLSATQTKLIFLSLERATLLSAQKFGCAFEG